MPAITHWFTHDGLLHTQPCDEDTSPTGAAITTAAAVTAIANGTVAHDCVEVETCSWCTIETLWSYLEQHQTDNGAYLCDDCWDDYTETSHELAKTV